MPAFTRRIQEEYGPNYNWYITLVFTFILMHTRRRKTWCFSSQIIPMVIPYANLMIKGRTDKKVSKAPECGSICVDHNSNPMSESEQSAVKSLQFENKIFAANGEAGKDGIIVSAEGFHARGDSGSQTDVRDEENTNRISANSRDFTFEQGNHVTHGCSNRESCCSNESEGSNLILDQKSPTWNEANGVAKLTGKSKQLIKLTRGLKFPKGTPNQSIQISDPQLNDLDKKDAKQSIKGVTPGNTKSKLKSVTGPPGKKPQESKVRLFNRKRRNRNKLISNAGNSLWRPLVCFMFHYISFILFYLL